MNKGTLVMFLFGMVLFSMASIGNGLECWYCNTQQNDNCTKPSSTNGIRTEKCASQLNPGAKFICRTVEFFVTREKRLHVSRSCYEEKDRSNNEACSKTLLVAFPKVKSCNTCATDRCNSKEISVQ